MAAIPTETEIKLVFEPGLRPKIERHPLFAGAVRAKPEHRELTTYFDTDDFLLHRHGYSLRTRKSGGHIVQTLKHVPDEPAAALQGDEWEWNLNNGRLLLGPVKQLLADSGLDGEFVRPKPRIVTEILRHSFEMEHDGCGIEAVIDEGVVRAGGREEAVHEVELEIKHGPAGPAYRLALQLLERSALRLGPESKADRGYRLLTGETPPRKARTAPLPQSATFGEALEWTIGTALQGFVANLPAAQAGTPEGVHQARVALRRVRSMLVLYAPCVERCAREHFNSAIRELGAVLGAARDWDVFIDETLGAAARAGVPADWIDALKEPAEVRREAARGAVREKLGSKAPAELVLGLEAWVGDPDWTTDSPRSSQLPVRKIMPGLMDRLTRKVSRRGRHLARLTASELHPLRKSVKKLRYSAQSTSRIYSNKSVKRHAKACKKLQEILGTINDSQVTTRLLADIAPRDSAALGAAAGALQRWNMDRQDGLRADLEKAWRKLKGVDSYWN
ncbi:MAG TPA: CYTH and CHAD domain-containing protein [Rhizomicrobium sp.]|nr:CYTH and CHAD domain-containing protein [Rhizomicrobium sp.]